jgi:hypothetical protein
VLGATESVKFGGEVTVSSADVLIPSDAAVMVEVPTAIPVANPSALIVAIAVLLLANVRGPPARGLPYWSLGEAVNCWVTPTCTDAACGVSVIEEKEGGAGFVEAGVGLPPQPTNKRKIRAIGARDVSFHFFSMIAKLVPSTVPFSNRLRGKFGDNDKERCVQMLFSSGTATSRCTGFASSKVSDTGA